MTVEEYKERVQSERQLDIFHRYEMNQQHNHNLDVLELSRQLFCKKTSASHCKRVGIDGICMSEATPHRKKTSSHKLMEQG